MTPQDQPDSSVQDQWLACSLPQQRFWALEMLEPHSTRLNIAARWQLDGEINRVRLEAAFNLVLARHDILRTSFREIDGEPWQGVAASIAFQLEHDDLGDLDEASRAREIDRLSLAEAKRPFDLARPPLLRARLLRTGAARCILLVTLHHMVADGWSVGILAKELGRIDGFLARGAIHDLRPLEIQYGDYTLWMQERMRVDEFAPSARYWATQLAGMRYCELVPDRPFPPNAAGQSRIASVLLDPVLMDSVAAVGRMHGNTLFVTMLGAIMVLLHRYTEQTDIAVGTQVAGRDEPELEGMIGVFINTVVMRGDLSGDPAFSALLGRLQPVVAAALEHQHMPGEQLLALLHPKRDLSKNPFFSVNFIFQRSFVENGDYDSYRLTDLPSKSSGSLYDQNIFMVERPEGWRLSCEYNSDQFYSETIEHQLQAICAILKGIAHGTSHRLSTLPLAETTLPDQPISQNHDAAWLHAAIAGHAGTRPDATAIRHAGRSLTYAALDRDSNRMARFLARTGLLPGMVVGLLLPRGLELVIVLLAVMKAGGVSVLLEQEGPEDLLLAQIKAARPSLLLAIAGHPGHQSWNSIRHVRLDEHPSEIGQESTAPLDLPADPGALACIVFPDSPAASTHAVTLLHAGLASRLDSLQSAMEVACGDVLLAVTPGSSHMALMELLLPLFAGGCVVVAEPAQAAHPPSLLALVRAHGITMMHAGATIWRGLLRAGWDGSPRLKMLCSGGHLSPGLLDRLLATGGPLWNLYAVAEATFCASLARLSAGTGFRSIGRPLPGCTMQVRDGRGRPLPVGAVGRLHVGGAGLAAGQAGWIDTRDMARLRGNGTIEFTGRVDRMARIHGFAAPLTEIEAVLLDHPALLDAMVVAPENDAAQNAHLSVCITAHADIVPPAGFAHQIQAWLDRLLPHYLKPEHFYVVASLPQTAGGRTDYRAALLSSAGPGHTAEGHSGDVEQRLTLLWAEVLGRRDFNVTDDFFDLGGHSLLATRLATRIAAAFGARVTVATLFQAPTITELSEWLQEHAAPA